MSSNKVCVAVISNGLVLVTTQDAKPCLFEAPSSADGTTTESVRAFTQTLTGQDVQTRDVLHLFTVPQQDGSVTALYVADAGADAVVTSTSGYWIAFDESRLLGDIAELFHDVWKVTGATSVSEWRTRIFSKTW